MAPAKDKAGPVNSDFRENLTSLLHGSGCKETFLFCTRQHEGAVWGTENRSLDSFLLPKEVPRKVPIREDSLCINPAQRRGGKKGVTPKPLYERYYIYVIWFLSVFRGLNKLSEAAGFKVLPATWTRAPPPAHQMVRVVVLSWFALELFSTSLKQE